MLPVASTPVLSTLSTSAWSSYTPCVASLQTRATRIRCGSFLQQHQQQSTAAERRYKRRRAHDVCCELIPLPYATARKLLPLSASRDQSHAEHYHHTAYRAAAAVSTVEQLLGRGSAACRQNL
eukprot:18388-Heterococcus_DN1.PRE.3